MWVPDVEVSGLVSKLKDTAQNKPFKNYFLCDSLRRGNHVIKVIANYCYFVVAVAAVVVVNSIANYYCFVVVVVVGFMVV